MRFRGPLLKVVVYPAGLLIQPIFMSPAAVLCSDIERLEVKSQSILGREMRVVFASRGVASPLVLFVAPDSALARAIERVAGMAFTDTDQSGLVTATPTPRHP